MCNIFFKGPSLALAALLILICSGCSGGGDNGSKEFLLKTNYPEKIIAYAKDLKTTAVLYDADSKVLSAPSNGELDLDNVWHFTIEPVTPLSQFGMILNVEFLYPYASSDLRLGALKISVSNLDNKIPFESNINDFDLLTDEDADGVSNVDELKLGLNPRLNDTDGDGVPDGIDAFPSIAAEWLDSDGDGVGDNKDNCPSNQNPDQQDKDSSGKGDVCDDDNLAPPPSVNVEVVVSVDPDSDSDGISDGKDNCPNFYNLYQDDADGDDAGDACDSDIDGDNVPNATDNCPYLANPKQLKEDQDGDGVSVECDLDEFDANVLSESGAVFVDVFHGADKARGTRREPVASIAAALAKAGTNGTPIYVAAGSYDVSNVSFQTNTKLFGAFANDKDAALRFASRDVKSDDEKYRTVFLRNDVPVTLMLGSEGIVIDGFSIENSATVFDLIQPSVVVDVKSGSVLIGQNKIIGNNLSQRSVGVRIKNATVDLKRNFIDAGGRDLAGSESKGVVIENGSVSASDNIVVAGGARFATGLDLLNSNASFINNTIDARSGHSFAGLSEGVELSYSSPVFTNNIIVTGNAEDQYAILCTMGQPDASAVFNKNLFAQFPYETSGVLVRDCDGVGYDDENFLLGSARVESNIVFSGGNFSDLLDLNYQLVDAGRNVGAGEW